MAMNNEVRHPGDESPDAARPEMRAPADARLLARHFVGQHRRPPGIADLDLTALPPAVRALFVHDGTLTTGLEALRGTPVVADLRIAQDIKMDQHEARWLGADPGARALRRRTAIRDADTRELLVEADSLVVLDRLPATFSGLLASNPKGLGAAMLDTRLEFRRELLWYGVDTLPDDVVGEGLPAGARLVVRCYRLIHQGLPVMCIKEGFVRLSSLIPDGFGGPPH
jgi:chorismate-pyruvate lyase